MLIYAALPKNYYISGLLHRNEVPVSWCKWCSLRRQVRILRAPPRVALGKLIDDSSLCMAPAREGKQTKGRCPVRARAFDTQLGKTVVSRRSPVRVRPAQLYRTADRKAGAQTKVLRGCKTRVRCRIPKLAERRGKAWQGTLYEQWPNPVSRAVHGCYPCGSQRFEWLKRCTNNA